MAKTFKGGVHPGHFKSATAGKPITPAQLPARVAILMQQHIGAPCEPLVSVGDFVRVGQKVGDSKGFVSAPVHASVSGKVVEIRNYLHPIGRTAAAVVIESDGEYTPDDSITANPSLENLSAGDLKKIIREAGIVGMGGATFPTHVKLSPPPDKAIDTVIINGAECEPFLTADHRLMLERPEDVVFGLKVIMKVLGVDKGYIGVEDNKPDCVEALQKAAAGEPIEVKALHTKYPQGAEKQLIYAFTGREVPPGGLPMDVGSVVQNAGTAAAIADAVLRGMPTVERIVTVTGPGVAEPANLLVKVGTMVSEVISQCGGLKENARKVILGGPMMGLAQTTMEMPVIKGTSGILVLTDAEVKIQEIKPCIRCGRCVEVCPVSILPLTIGSATEKGLLDKAEAYYAVDCIECGCCSYICPAKRPLTQWIRMSKGEILAKRKK
jgi:Na+-translocating ferredoxin:NAD+ oxidoreductase subunit C